MRWVSRFAKLRPVDVPVVARAFFWMVAARVMLKARGFDRTRLALGLRSTSDPDRPRGARPRLAPVDDRALRVALRVLEPAALGVTCLPRAIAVERVMRARGIATEVVLGCVTGEGFKAHAWVELDGYAVGWGEAGRSSWSPLARFSVSA